MQMNGIRFDTATNDYGVWVNGEAQGYRATCAEAMELLKECVARYARAQVPCAWMDSIEATQEVWELAA